MSFNPPAGADYPDSYLRNMEVIVDGMRHLLRRNFCAQTNITMDVSIGDTIINVTNSLQFSIGDEIVLRDNTSQWDDDRENYTGIEYHRIQKILGTGQVLLELPAQRAFLAANQAIIQKALRKSFLWAKDIYYGDRATAVWDNVAICVEPVSRSGEWLAINGLLSDEWTLDILIYVKVATTEIGQDGRDPSEETAMRTCNQYGDAIRALLVGNIHTDIAVDEVALALDAEPGDNYVTIPAYLASFWPADRRATYEVQDNYNSNWNLAIINRSTSSSSSSTSYSSQTESQSSSSNSTAASVSSSTAVSQSSSFSSSSASSQESSQSSSSSSSSSWQGATARIYLSAPLSLHFKVSNKAVLRRKKRYIYNSLPSEVTYGTTQKGVYMLKAGRISWFGKETQVVPFPQIGKGGDAY